MGGLPDVTPDCFDLEGIKKQFEELKEKAKDNLSFDPKKIADAIGDSKITQALEKFDKFTPCKDIIANIADNDTREKVLNAVTELRKKQLGGGTKSEPQKTEEPKRSAPLKKATRGFGDGMIDQLQSAMESHSEAADILKQNIGGKFFPTL